MAFRVIQQSLWTDEKVIDEYSCEDKYFWLYLLTNPQVNQLGIYKLPIKLAAFQLGYSKEQVIVLLDRFQNYLKQIKYNKETQEIAIGNYLAYSVVKGGKPVYDCAVKDLAKVKDLTLVDFVLSKLNHKEIDNKTVNDIIEILKEKSTKKENYEDDNDNDNDDTPHESPNDSPHDSCSNSKKNKSSCPYQEIIDLYHSICVSYPKLRGLTESRKKHINARWKEYKDIEVFRELFEKTENSSFLKGESKDGWKANFDWLMKPDKFIKVLENSYKGTSPEKPKSNLPTDEDYDGGIF